jgi:UDP-N-acetylglucosamine diphosphorylase / glucose-1-phosphate thymidylyltransferase / UDP-N-acetylgalactosamine diphosphorylase / glucosamine-1-phosphate N-acetyltransferase / galactosamine-1-phosphate N-acetyltransferase
MKKQLVAVVLAGGVGNRFWPLSKDKVLFPWFGKPLLHYSVNEILPHEVSRVVVVTNGDNNAALSSLSFGVPSVTVIQHRPLGMADAILTAASELADCSLLILNGDDITDGKMITDVVRKGMNGKAFGVIPGLHRKTYFPGGYLVVDGEKILNIIEKPGTGNEPSAYVATLGHFIADSNILLDELRRTPIGDDDMYERAISMLMKRHTFVMHPYEGSFAALKYPWDVLDMNQVLLARMPDYRGKHVVIGPNVTFEGNVYIEDNVRIFENTKIIGPTYIGKGTIIGNNNIIRQSYIGAGCVTGFNTDITRSYIGDSCWFHTNYIGDSVCEGNLSMGSGATLANLRLDDGEVSSMVNNELIPTGRTKLGSCIGKNVRIGVNASIMPGIKIGAGSFIGSGVVLDKDIPINTYCVVKQTLVTLHNNKSVNETNRDEFKKQL